MRSSADEPLLSLQQDHLESHKTVSFLPVDLEGGREGDCCLPLVDRHFIVCGRYGYIGDGCRAMNTLKDEVLDLYGVRGLGLGVEGVRVRGLGLEG
jgi:hypothetical protein